MAKWWLVVVMLLAGSGVLSAQQLSDAYYKENPSWVDAELWAQDGNYLLAPKGIFSPYEKFSLYGFSFIDHSFRSGEELATRLGNIEIVNPLSRYPDYNLLSLLRRVPSSRELRGVHGHTLRGAEGRVEIFDTSPSGMSSSSNIKTQFSTRTYLFGAGYSIIGITPRGFNYSLAVGGRWGRDAQVEGIFSEEEYLWLSGERVWRDMSDRRQSVQLSLMVAPTIRSQRSWNTEEVFSLAGDDLYNSYWGWQDGKVRSSRVRRECIPALYVAWNCDDSYILSNINISALLRGGRRSRSTLDWEGVPSPMADYYAYLPSGASDPEVGHLAGEVWRNGDERYTQIDWESLYHTNALSVEGARYALMQEREDVLSGVVDISAGLLGLEGGRVGATLTALRSHNYNTPTDLLGADRLIDGFDLYDYSLCHLAWKLYGSFHRTGEWGTLSAGVELGDESVEYRGMHTARKATNDNLVVRSRVAWSRGVGESLMVGATARYDHLAPLWSDAMGSAEGALSINPYAGGINRFGAELWGSWNVGSDVTLSGSIYSRSEVGVSSVEHFWNDLMDEYCALVVGGLNRVATGVELSAEMDVTRSLSLAAHCSAGVAKMVSDGVGDIVTYDEGRMIAEGVVLHTRGIGYSSTPTLTTALTARYTTPRGWLIGAEWAFVAGRRLEPSLLLHSDYILSRNLTPEEYLACVTQKSLGNAHSVGVFVWRKFGALSLSLSVRNLLNDTSAYSAGYQPSRLTIVESDTKIGYSPHSARYQHIYPRWANLTIGYEF